MSFLGTVFNLILIYFILTHHRIEGISLILFLIFAVFFFFITVYQKKEFVTDLAAFLVLSVIFFITIDNYLSIKLIGVGIILLAYLVKVIKSKMQCPPLFD